MMLQKADPSDPLVDEFGVSIWSVLRRRAGILIATPLIFLALAILAIRLMPLQYSATAVVWLRPQAGLTADGQPQPDRLAERQQASLYELRSLPVMMAVVDKLSLENEPEFADRLKSHEGLRSFADGVARALLGSAPRVQLKPEEEQAIRKRQLAELAREQLQVAPEGTERITLTYRAKRPRLAYDMALNVAEEHQNAKNAERKERIEYAVSALRQRIAYLRTRLDEQSRALVQADSARLIEMERAMESPQQEIVLSVPPVVPTEPSRPSLKLVTALALFAGFMVAALIVILIEVAYVVRNWARR